MPSPLLPADVLARLFAADATRPRLTWYDDEPGPTAGERIELSARVLGNWVAKAANLLQDDLSAEPGTTVGLDLPTHWRALYWALAAWSVGAEVVVGDAATGADVLVTASAQAAAAHGRDAVLVALPALARSHPEAGEAPAAVDEARELSTHGDVFAPLADPEPSDVALATGSGTLTYGEVVVPDPAWGGQPRVALRGPLDVVLRRCLAAWAADGSVVLERGSGADPSPGRHASEGVTVDAPA
jgi:uncharacterized protein (TIGR03089 family)